MKARFLSLSISFLPTLNGMTMTMTHPPQFSVHTSPFHQILGFSSLHSIIKLVLLIGDSGVGKSSLLLTFVSSTHSLQDLAPTIGVDFKMRQLTVAGKRLKLTFWDTAGQERFGTLVGSYYRGAHAIILVYDVTRRETFTNLSEIWAKEADKACSNQECVKILVGNKVDRESERRVSRKEGMSLAEEHKCSFFECSAKTRDKVDECFRQIIFKILEKPSLLEKGSLAVKKQIWSQKQVHHERRGCCS